MIVLLALAILLMAAPAAQAGGAYGVLTPGSSLLTFEVEGNALRAAALRISLPCEDEGAVTFAANFTLARAARNGDEFLLRERSQRGTLRYRIHADWGRGRDLWRWRGTLIQCAGSTSASRAWT